MKSEKVLVQTIIAKGPYRFENVLSVCKTEDKLIIVAGDRTTTFMLEKVVGWEEVK